MSSILSPTERTSLWDLSFFSLSRYLRYRDFGRFFGDRTRPKRFPFVTYPTGDVSSRFLLPSRISIRLITKNMLLAWGEGKLHFFWSSVPKCLIAFKRDLRLKRNFGSCGVKFRTFFASKLIISKWRFLRQRFNKYSFAVTRGNPRSQVAKKRQILYLIETL